MVTPTSKQAFVATNYILGGGGVAYFVFAVYVQAYYGSDLQFMMWGSGFPSKMLMILGVGMMLVMVLGIYTFYKQNYYMYEVFIAFLVVVLIFQISVTAIAFHRRIRFTEYSGKLMRNMQERFKDPGNLEHVFAMENLNKCCAVLGGRDYLLLGGLLGDFWGKVDAIFGKGWFTDSIKQIVGGNVSETCEEAGGTLHDVTTARGCFTVARRLLNQYCFFGQVVGLIMTVNVIAEIVSICGILSGWWPVPMLAPTYNAPPDDDDEED